MTEESSSRILIVDDEVNVVELVKMALSGEGFEVLTAYTAEEAFEAVVSTKPDIILLDVNMSGVSGIDICKRLKSSEESRAIPVIFLSGVSHQKEIDKGLAVGASAYVTKPFKVDRLADQIRQLLKKN